MRTLESRLVVLEDICSLKVNKHIALYDEFSFKVNHPSAIEYDPISNSVAGTFKDFHTDSSMLRLLVGPFGSGKTTACCSEIVLRTCNNPPFSDGVRRAKWAIIRNTMGELESTTLQTWLKWFGKLGVITRTKKPILQYNYNFNDGKGIVELQLIFIGLDREDDRRKLESLDISCAYVNEMQHVPRGVVTHLIGRIGRFSANSDQYAGMIADTNPPDEDHWIYNDFEQNPIEGNRIFYQPPGLIRDNTDNWHDNAEADNIKHLRKNYYFNMARANRFNEEFVKVYCQGKYGIVIPGKKVFQEYNDDVHSVAEVDSIPDQPIGVFWDYGMTPCALIVQLSESGQLRCLKEFITERSSVRSLAKNWVKPYLDNKLAGFPFFSVGDPSGSAAKETEGTSPEDVLADEGMETIGAKTNAIGARIEAVKGFFNKMVVGQPALLISRSGCPTLRKSLLGKYCYKRIRVLGDEKYRDLPDKTHPWSDIVDCLQYAACEYSGEGIRAETTSAVDLSKFVNTEQF